MTLYELLLFVHVSCAAIWLGGALWTQVHGYAVARSGDAQRMAQFAGEVGHLGERVFIPASFGVLLAGVGLMLEGSWPWARLWVLFALAAFAGSFLVGLLILSPTAKGIAKAIEADGPQSPEAQRLISKVFRIGRAELVFLYAIAFAMVAKPTADDVWTIAIGGVTIVALTGWFLLRGSESGPVAQADAA